MSVDVVGSTAFKHTSDHAKSQRWLDFFISFYTEFPDLLATCLEKQAKTRGRSKIEVPSLWKSLGDELIFAAEITHNSQVGQYICAFRNAVIEAVKYYAQGEKPLPVSFKATAWLAGFPVGNAAIPLNAEAPVTPAPCDFAGPLIDVGFRLSRLSSPRRFTVSVDLAYLLLESEAAGLNFFYEGRERLKGVLETTGYPVIWIDCDSPAEKALHEMEDGLLGRDAVAERDLKKFCRAFIERTGEPLMIPFIPSDTDFSNCPPDYDEALKVIDDRLRRVFIVANPAKAAKTTDRTKSLEDLKNWQPTPKKEPPKKIRLPKKSGRTKKRGG